jgi:hypothetical protein
MIKYDNLFLNDDVMKLFKIDIVSDIRSILDLLHKNRITIAEFNGIQ